ADSRAEVMMRLGSVLPCLATLASGCASVTWGIDHHGARALSAIAVAEVEIAGDADAGVAYDRRDRFVDALRARGYDVRDAAPGGGAGGALSVRSRPAFCTNRGIPVF